MGCNEWEELVYDNCTKENIQKLYGHKNVTNLTKEKSYLSTTTNNLSTTAGNFNFNTTNIKYFNSVSNENILDDINLEEFHFYMVYVAQNYKKFDSNIY